MIHRYRHTLQSVLIFVFIALVNPRTTHATVVINEIFPKSADAKQTWIELYNTAAESVSLDRWKLEINTNSASFVFNASATIAPNGFLTIYQTQSGITMSTEGDTVLLFDDKNNLVDTQSYPGVLGYNTTMGRSPDGGAGWVICTPQPDYVATPNKTNQCPPPSTNTPTPYQTPTASVQQPLGIRITSIPTMTPVTTASTIDPSSSFAYPEILGSITRITPTPTPAPVNFFQTDVYKKIWLIALISGISIAILIMSIGLYRSYKRKI